MASRQGKADAFAGMVAPLASEMKGAGKSLATIAAELTSQGVQTPQGGTHGPAITPDRCLILN